RPPATSTLFPYTTLFRSNSVRGARQRSAPWTRNGDGGGWNAEEQLVFWVEHCRSSHPADLADGGHAYGRRPIFSAYFPRPGFQRSEEHTSELQSRENLVC